MQTGRPLTARLSGEYRPLSKNPVSSAQIEALLAGSPLAALLPREDGNESQVVQLGERSYKVRLARRGPALQIRLEANWAKANSEVRGDSQVGPLPENSQVGPLPSDRPSGMPERHSSSPAIGERTSSLPLERTSSLPLERNTTPERATTSQPPLGARAPTGQNPLGGRSATGSPPGSTAPDPPRLRRDAHGAVTRPVDVDELPPGVRLGAAPMRATTGNPAAAPTPVAPPAAPVGRPLASAATTASPMAPHVARRTGGPGGPLLALVQQAREKQATDLHIAAGQPPLIRTAGELLRSGDAPLDEAAVEHLLLPLLDDAQKKQLSERGYVDLGLDLQGGGRLRVNISRQRTGLKGSFRLVVHPTPTIESLGLPKELTRVTTYHQGLVVIAGPNGHGKTTTLAAIVDQINATRPHHILTVEEPVEFIHERKQAVMSQREVGLHTRTFASALKASLREDPDVIVIGELRDRETVEIALTAAETGHLVMVTMSTPSAAKTIDRLIDFFPPEDQNQVRASLAGALKFIVAQRLIPAASGKGFVPAVELLTGVPPLWALIRDNKLFQLPSLQQRGRAYGMIRFDDSLAELVKSGKVTPDVAMAYAENKKEFALNNRPAPPAPLPGVTQGVAVQAAEAAATNAAKGLQDLKSKVGGLFGGPKKE